MNMKNLIQNKSMIKLNVNHDCSVSSFLPIHSEYRTVFSKFSSLTLVCNLGVKCPYVMGELIVSDLNADCVLPIAANQGRVGYLLTN